jgi:hypothetical protein
MLRNRQVIFRFYGLFMNVLLEVYAPWFPMRIGLSGSSVKSAVPHGGWNGSDSCSDGAVRGSHRILRAISGCALHGVQASFDWVLGASATRLWGKGDSSIGEVGKTSEPRRLRTGLGTYRSPLYTRLNAILITGKDSDVYTRGISGTIGRNLSPLS